MDKNSKIYIAGHTGLIGSAIYEKLINENFKNIIIRTKKELDLTNQEATKIFFEEEKPEYVFLCSGLVGGLYSADIYKSEYIYHNMMMEANVINASFENDIKKLIFFSSADIYSTTLPQPYKEKDLIKGQLDFYSSSFVISKAATLKMCESYNSQFGTDFICLIVSNLYGKKQLYDSLNSTVIPALIKRFYDAKENKNPEVKVWGSGENIRNFIYIDDLVDGALFLMDSYCDDYIYNISYDEDITIASLANIISQKIGYKGKIVFDKNKPEGVYKKTIDTNSLSELGFECKINLEDGIRQNYEYFLAQIENKTLKQKEIQKISKIQKDISILEKLNKNSTNNFIQPKDYKSMVVLKPWGYEFLIFENEDVAVWFLFIKNGFSTSMHCHPKKKTSLVVINGKAYSNTFSNKRYLNEHEAVIIDDCVFHSTKCLNESGLFLIELETPPDKTDLVRLKDRYGRQNSGYEGTSEMRENNLKEDFDYFDFFTEKEVFIQNKKMSLENYSKYDIDSFTPSTNELIMSFSGIIRDAHSDEIVLDLGDVEYGYKFLQSKKLITEDEKVTILRIKTINE